MTPHGSHGSLSKTGQPSKQKRGPKTGEAAQVEHRANGIPIPPSSPRRMERKHGRGAARADFAAGCWPEGRQGLGDPHGGSSPEKQRM